MLVLAPLVELGLRGRGKPCPTLIPQRLSRLKHVPNSILGLASSNQRQKCFPFEIEQVLLADPRRMIQIASGQDPRQLLTNQRIMIRDVSRPLHQVHAEFESRQRRRAESENVRLLLRLYIA